MRGLPCPNKGQGGLLGVFYASHTNSRVLFYRPLYDLPPWMYKGGTVEHSPAVPGCGRTRGRHHKNEWES